VQIFKRNKRAGSETSRTYLTLAPPGIRTELLVSSCVLGIRKIDICQPPNLGQILTPSRLAPASEVVRSKLYQDRELVGWVAQKAAAQLISVLQRFMTGDFDANLAEALASVGLDPESEHATGQPQRHEDSDAKSAACLGATFLSLMKTVCYNETALSRASPRHFVDPNWLYMDPYTGSIGSDASKLNFRLIAWQAVLVGRLLNTSRIASNCPYFLPEHRATPRMSAAGWYPNPGQERCIVHGDAEFQTYWNGEQWTDQARIRRGMDWQRLTVQLYRSPDEEKYLA
jgi:hypothetical protein